MPYQTSLRTINKSKHIAGGNVPSYLLTIINVVLKVCKYYLFTHFRNSWYECYGTGKF